MSGGGGQALDGELGEEYLACQDAMADLYAFSPHVPYGDPLLALQARPHPRPSPPGPRPSPPAPIPHVHSRPTRPVDLPPFPSTIHPLTLLSS